MYSVTAKNLTKTYRTQVKQPGLRAAFRALVRPEYREVQAVRGIDLQVEQGQRLAFIGPNGAGKSTTIKMMTGILSPTSGALSVLGLSPMENRRELSRHIGTVFGQKSQLWFHLPAADSFKLLGAIYDIDGPTLEKAVEALGSADLLIIGGTSLAVYPAAGLIQYFGGDRLVLLNRDVTPYDRRASLCIREPIGRVLGQIKVR